MVWVKGFSGFSLSGGPSSPLATGPGAEKREKNERKLRKLRCQRLFRRNDTLVIGLIWQQGQHPDMNVTELFLFGEKLSNMHIWKG